MGENPVALKSELLMSTVRTADGSRASRGPSINPSLTAAPPASYHDFIKSGGKARQPTLSGLAANEIKRQPERRGTRSWPWPPSCSWRAP